MLAALLVCPQGWPPCMQQKPGIYCPKQIAYSIIVCLVNTEVSETALCGTNKSTVSNYELAIILVPHFKLQEPPINLQNSHVPWICKLFSSRTKRNMRLHGVLSTMYSINRFFNHLRRGGGCTIRTHYFRRPIQACDSQFRQVTALRQWWLAYGSS